MIYLESAEYLKDYRLRLTFNTGETGEVDLSDLPALFDAAKPLQKLTEFKKFYLDEWPTLAWPCGFDLAPEMLYERATGKKHNFKEAI
ncbi:Protein of unknown function [Marinospirillum celere]|uniref:DUF2442 domain-containing protein n=1 Tax=Marinospirillum celere TaxID=1122252 RepID=A0A1I1E882_9GAMM|nr:DUF2442 domain-containing protein [Marinospirillum celere]SFB83267.1 Protein of unknown function [Marinospirillum celere]